MSATQTQSDHFRPTALQQAGVTNRHFSNPSLELREITAATMIRIHSLDPPERLTATLPGVGSWLPEETGQSAGWNPAALCLRPQEWLLFCETDCNPDLLQEIASATDSQRTAVIDQSHGLAVFRLSGTAAPWLLGKLSCLDFLAGISEGQHCTQTRFAHCAVLVHYHDHSRGGYCFDLIFDRSIAKYMWSLLTASADHATELARNFEMRN